MISDPRCGTDVQLVEYSMQSEYSYHKNWKNVNYERHEFCSNGSEAPRSGSEPWHRILDPSTIIVSLLHGYRDDFSCNVGCCNPPSNGIVQYVFPALSPAIDIGTSDIPPCTWILCST